MTRRGDALTRSARPANSALAPRDPRRGALSRFSRHRAGRLGAVFITVLVAFAAVGPHVAGHDPLVSDFVHGVREGGMPVGPNATFLLGTDRLFRDQFARLALGARFSLTIAISATLLSTALGSTVGIVAGYFEGTPVSAMLMRAVDVGLAFPFLLLVMAIGAALDEITPTTIFLVLGLTGWLGTARIVRAKTLEVRRLDYVTAAQALGQRTIRILASHILPNIAGPIIVVSTLSVAQMLLAETVLNWLGLGLAPPAPTWGRMLLEGADVYGTAPWILAAPAIALLAAVLGFNLVGVGLRDAHDPAEN